MYMDVEKVELTRTIEGDVVEASEKFEKLLLGKVPSSSPGGTAAHEAQLCRKGGGLRFAGVKQPGAWWAGASRVLLRAGCSPVRRHRPGAPRGASAGRRAAVPGGPCAGRAARAAGGGGWLSPEAGKRQARWAAWCACPAWRPQVPIMLRSRFCSLYDLTEKELADLGECPYDQVCWVCFLVGCG